MRYIWTQSNKSLGIEVRHNFLNDDYRLICSIHRERRTFLSSVIHRDAENVKVDATLVLESYKFPRKNKKLTVETGPNSKIKTFATIYQTGSCSGSEGFVNKEDSLAVCMKIQFKIKTMSYK